MMRIALVDDDKQYLVTAEKYIRLCEKESGDTFFIETFATGMDFITEYKPVYDIVFLDIDMPLIDGMTVARKLREIDEKIVIVFVTQMHRYAVEGYEVNAADFIVKPIRQFAFTDKLKKAISIAQANKEHEIIVRCDGSFVRLPTSRIDYIEKDKNYLIYHTSMGEFRERGTIDGIEEKLKKYGFSRCNSGCFVNIANVSKLSQSEVTVNGTVLSVSRSRIKELKQDVFLMLRGG